METTTVKVNPILQRIYSVDKAVRHELSTHAHEYNGRLIPKQEASPDSDNNYRLKVIYYGGSISASTLDYTPSEISLMKRVTQTRLNKIIYNALTVILE
jgi:hypothetical protein